MIDFQAKQKKAENQLNRAIKEGLITKPSACIKCHKKANLHGHHYNYDKPFDVFWLCIECHRKIHSYKKDKKERNNFTTSEVAQKFGVSVPTIRQWCNKGYLTYFSTPGGQRRITKESLRGFLQTFFIKGE